MKNKVIPIFFTVDDNYIPFLAVTLESLTSNHKTEEILEIKILHTGISKENITKINKYQSSKVKVEFVDVKEYMKQFQDKLYTRDYYSCTTYFRLFIPQMYPKYDKAIYIDSDCVVLDDISKLYDIDIEDNLLIATPDDVIQNEEVFHDYAEKVVGLKSYKNYFNAGVIVMNLKELRKMNFQDKFLYLLTHIKFEVAQDQDYLNRICKGRVKLIPNTWDRMPIGKDIIPREELKLIHYNLHLKPWHFDNILYEEYFWFYAKKSEYYSVICQNKENYTDEQRKNDVESYDKLLKLTAYESSCVGDDR